MRYLVKDPREINDDHISLLVTKIKMGFARPMTSETMLRVSKNAFKGLVLVKGIGLQRISLISEESGRRN